MDFSGIIVEFDDITENLPRVSNDNMYIFGEVTSQRLDFTNHSLLIAQSKSTPSESGLQLMYYGEKTSAHVTISSLADEEETGPKNTESASLGVKDAMKHFLSTMTNEEPRNTIKGLLKQIMINQYTTLDPEELDNARTIAEIYEVCAKGIENSGNQE